MGAPENTPKADPLTDKEVRQVARLSRLCVAEEDLARERERLGAVLGYVARLHALDLEGVAPMAHTGDEVNRLRPDEPGEAVPNDALMDMAPETLAPFVRVPKVLGDGGGA